MKKLVMRFLLFVIFTILTYILLLFILGNRKITSFIKPNIPNNLSFSSLMFNDLRKLNNCDILFLGSSHCYRGFDPRVFKNIGYNIFNLGTSSQTPLHTEALLKSFIDKLNPKFIIYEVYPFTFSDEIDLVESSISIFANTKVDINLFSLFLQSPDIRLFNLMNFNLLFNNSYISNNDVTNKSLNNEKYIYNGYVEKKDFNLSDVQKIKMNSIKFNYKQFESLKRVVNLCSTRNIKIIFIFAPVTKKLYKSITNIGEFNDRLSSIGKFYNFNELMNLDDRFYFYDNHHLNHYGVHKFNERLIMELDLHSKNNVISNK